MNGTSLRDMEFSMVGSFILGCIESRCARAWRDLYEFERYYGVDSSNVKCKRTIAVELLGLLEDLIGYEMYYDERANCMKVIGE